MVVDRSTKALWRENIYTEPRRALRCVAYHPGPLQSRFPTTQSTYSYQSFSDVAQDRRRTQPYQDSSLWSAHTQIPACLMIVSTSADAERGGPVVITERHTDATWITLLATDETGGLQVGFH